MHVFRTVQTGGKNIFDLLKKETNAKNESNAKATGISAVANEIIYFALRFMPKWAEGIRKTASPFAGFENPANRKEKRKIEGDDLFLLPEP